jgi:hypothetical protein
MKSRAVLFILLGAALVAMAQIGVYARNQNARADGWREEYFDLLDVLDHVQQHSPDALEGSGRS